MSVLCPVVCIVFSQSDTCKFFYVIDHRYIFAFTVYINFYITEVFLCVYTTLLYYGIFVYTSYEVMHVLCMHVIVNVVNIHE